MKKINLKTLLVTLLLSQAMLTAPTAEANTFEKARKALEVAKEKAKEIKDRAVEATKESIDKLEKTIENSKVENDQKPTPKSDEKPLDNIDPGKKIDIGNNKKESDTEKISNDNLDQTKDEKIEDSNDEDSSNVKIISSGKHDNEESISDLATNDDSSGKVISAKGDGKPTLSTSQTQSQSKPQQSTSQHAGIFPWNKADLGRNNTDQISYDSTLKIEYSVKSDRNWAYFQIQKANSVNQPEKHVVPVHSGYISTVITLRDGPGKYNITLYTTTSSTRNATYYQYLAFNKTVENKDSRDNTHLLPSDDVQSKDDEIISLAREIVGNSKTQREAVVKINKWIMDNIKYDYVALNNGSYATSRQDALTTLRERMAVCEGFSNLFAALARASGIRTKVMSGLGDGGMGFNPHAWNEVFFDGQWHNIDSTWDQNLGKQTYIFMNDAAFKRTHKNGIPRENR